MLEDHCVSIRQRGRALSLIIASDTCSDELAIRHAVECHPTAEGDVARPPLQGLNLLNIEQSQPKALYEHGKPTFGPTI